MIISMNLLVTTLYLHIALAHILPRQSILRYGLSFKLLTTLTARLAKSFFPYENKTSPSSPNITPGSCLSSGGIAAEKYFRYRAKIETNPFNDTISRHSPSNASINASLCRFVVQDTININYWASYSTLANYYMFNITSIVTEVTQYIDTTITKHLTNVRSTTTHSSTSHEDGRSYPLGPPNNAGEPLRAITKLKKDADLTSWGSTFLSPGTFYIYPTVKILTVPAITQQDGQLACTTAVTRQYFYDDENSEAGKNPCGVRVFTGMNSNAQRYFDSSRFYHGGNSPKKDLQTHEPSKSDVATTITTTHFIEEFVFATPFVYKPDWGLNRDDYGGYNLTTGPRPCPGVFEHLIADYGYVPQAVIDKITTPGESLLPGGPSILDDTTVLFASNGIILKPFLTPAEDLTDSTAFTITSRGCFNPEGCLIHDAPDTVTTSLPIAQTQLQRLTSDGGVIPQTSKTRFSASLEKTYRVTLALKPSAVASKVSAVSSAELAHPVGESPIVTKVSASQSPDTVTTTLPTSQSQLQRLTSKGGFLPQASKTSLPASPDNTHQVTSALKPSAVASKESAVSSAETSHLVGESLITTKVLASLSQSPSSITELLFESQTFTPGGIPRLFSSKLYSLTPSATAHFFNDVASTLASKTSQGSKPTTSVTSDGLYVDGSIFQVTNKPSPYIVGGYKVMPGSAPVVVSGTTYSLDSSAATIVVNDVVSPLPKFEEKGSQLFTANAASGYLVGGRTISPTGDAIVMSGSTYSLAGQASALVVNGVTSLLPTIADSNPLPEIKIDSQYLTLGPTLGYNLGGKTLIAGAKPIVFSGTTYSLAPQATALVVNGVTSSLRSVQRDLPRSTPVSGRLQYILGGQTLSPGVHAITISGVAVSLAASGNTIVINGTSYPFQPGTATSLTIGSQFLIATPASGPILYNKTSKIGAAASTTSNGNTPITPSAANLGTGSTNGSISTSPSINGDQNPSSVFTDGVSRGEIGWTERLMMFLVVLGLTVLQAS